MASRDAPEERTWLHVTLRRKGRPIALKSHFPASRGFLASLHASWWEGLEQGWAIIFDKGPLQKLELCWGAESKIS